MLNICFIFLLFFQEKLSRCPEGEGFILQNNKCYYLSREGDLANYRSGESACSAKGNAILARGSTEELWENIQELVHKANDWFVIGLLKDVSVTK